MRIIDCSEISKKSDFNNYDDYGTYPQADIPCAKCCNSIKIHFNNLQKHSSNSFSHLRNEDQLKMNIFIQLNQLTTPNSWLDYYCPNCHISTRLYYESWVGGRHGEYGFRLCFVLFDV